MPVRLATIHGNDEARALVVGKLLPDMMYHRKEMDACLELQLSENRGSSLRFPGTSVIRYKQTNDPCHCQRLTPLLARMSGLKDGVL